MFRKHTTWNKVKAILVLTIIFLMILATNSMDNSHFDMVKRSFESIYKDRVVVHDYIFQIYRLVESKKAYINSMKPNGDMEFADHSYDTINKILDKYAKTKFSVSENMRFNSLKIELNNMRTLEDKLSSKTDIAEREKIITDVNNHVSTIASNLQLLSEIQVDESKSLFDNSNRLIESSYLMSRIEIGFLIAIGSIIIIIIMVKPST